MIDKNLQAWSFKNSVNFYVSERTRAADLYKSEAAMLLPVIPYVRSVLDIGCAVGNFRTIFQDLNPAISYVGVDTSTGMIAEARRRHPGVKFEVVEGNRPLPFADGSFDLVLCTGVLNHNPDYLDLIADAVRVAGSFAVIDLPRLVTGPYSFDLATSFMQLDERFPDNAAGITREATKVPYMLANVGDAFGGILTRLPGKLSGFACCGYYGTTHQSVTIPYEKVIFTVVLLVKGTGPVRYNLDLPADALALAEPALAAVASTKVNTVDAVVGRKAS